MTQSESGVTDYRRPRLNTFGCLLLMGSLLLISFMIYGHSRVEANSGISITAKVGAPVPDVPANINSPQSGQLVAGENTPVEGTCQPKTYITVLSNGAIRGGAICSEEGSFALQVDLNGGKNSLIARTNDGIDQTGPESTPVIVNADAKEAPVVSVNKAYQRIGQEDTLVWQLKLEGEAKTYAVHVDWGDGTSDLLPTAEKVLTLSHKYEKAGAMGVKITASDDQRNSTKLNLVASVSSLETLDGGVVSAVGRNLSNTALYVTVVLMAASFIVGSNYRGGKKQYVWAQKERQAKEITQEKNYYLVDSSSPAN